MTEHHIYNNSQIIIEHSDLCLRISFTERTIHDHRQHNRNYCRRNKILSASCSGIHQWLPSLNIVNPKLLLKLLFSIHKYVLFRTIPMGAVSCTEGDAMCFISYHLHPLPWTQNRSDCQIISTEQGHPVMLNSWNAILCFPQTWV